MDCWSCHKRIDPHCRITVWPGCPGERQETTTLVQDYTREWWSFSRLDIFRIGKWIINYSDYRIDGFACSKCGADLERRFLVTRNGCGDYFIKDLVASTVDIL